MSFSNTDSLQIRKICNSLLEESLTTAQQSKGPEQKLVLAVISSAYVNMVQSYSGAESEIENNPDSENTTAELQREMLKLLTDFPEEYTLVKSLADTMTPGSALLDTNTMKVRQFQSFSLSTVGHSFEEHLTQ